MNSRPKRAAALAAVEAIQDEQKVQKKQRTETTDGDDSDYDSAYDPTVGPLPTQSENDTTTSTKRSKKTKDQDEPTLRDLIHSLHSGTGTTSWRDVQKRLFSHPSEACPRDFYAAVQIHSPPIRRSVLWLFVHSGDVIRWEAFKFVTTCPWLPISLVKDLLSCEEKIIRSIAQDNEDIFDRHTVPGARLNRLFGYCTKVFGLLRNPNMDLPPRIEIVTEILKPSFALAVLSTRDEARCVPMHNVCHHETNLEYVRLLARAGKDGDDDTSEEHDLNPFYGGLLERDNFGRTPLWRIARHWSDEKAAEIMQELLDLYSFPIDGIPDDVLHEAIQGGKWELCKVIIHKLPRTLLNHWSVGNHPLHEVVLKDGPLNTPMALLMVEQALRATTADDGVFRNTCGLLTKKNWANKSPLKVLFLSSDDSKGTEFCKEVISYIVMGMETSDDASAEDGNNLLALFKELIILRRWNILQHFIEKFPSQITLKDEEGNLLLHLICGSANSPLDLIHLAINTGLREGAGGKNGRGGLAVANNLKQTPLQVLSSRCAGSNNKLFKTLMESSKPKLILQKDFKNLNLLHAVADGGKVTVARQILQARPESISFVDDDGRLPIHVACMHSPSASQTKMIRLLLSEGVNQNLGGKGGLLLADDKNLTPLDHLVSNLPWDERRWSSINILFEGIVEDVPLIQSAIEEGLSRWKLKSLIANHKDSLKTKDEFGCLPLHVFLTKEGSEPDEIYKQIFDLYPAAAIEPDGDTGLYPFQTAASLPNWKTTDVYDLLRSNPSTFSYVSTPNVSKE